MFQQPDPKKKPDKVLADPNKWSGFLYLLITHPRGWLGMTVVAAIGISAALTAITVINPEQIEILTNSGSIALRRGSTQDAIIQLIKVYLKKIFYYLQLAELEAAVRGEDFKSWSEETKRKKKEEQHQRRNKGWDSIKKNKDWNIWYNDNVGAFSVSITVNEKD